MLLQVIEWMSEPICDVPGQTFKSSMASRDSILLATASAAGPGPRYYRMYQSNVPDLWDNDSRDAQPFHTRRRAVRTARSPSSVVRPTNADESRAERV